MKLPRPLFLGSFILVGLQFGLSGCVTDGSVQVETGVYYGHRYRDPWFRDDRWVDGHGWYRGGRQPERGGTVDIYISPPRPPIPRLRLP